jgi:hypothetical protein
MIARTTNKSKSSGPVGTCRNSDLSNYRQLDGTYLLPNHNDIEYKNLQMISDGSRLHLNSPS